MLEFRGRNLYNWMSAFRSRSLFIFLLKRSQSKSKVFLHGKDAFVLAHIIVQIPPTEFQHLQVVQ